MRRRAWRWWATGFLAIAGLSALYLFTWGHVFLPLPSPASYEGTPVETRRYQQTLLPAFGSSWSDRMDELKWVMKSPGRVRLAKVSGDLPSSANSPRDMFSLLYPFPEKADVQCGDKMVPFLEITHHAAMLDRIEKDLRLERLPASAP
jgi:hypothetical protein